MTELVGSPPKLWPTLGTCLLILVAWSALAWRLTDGFESWTFEDQRRRGAIAGDLHASDIVLRDASGAQRNLFEARLQPTGRNVFLVDFIYTRCTSVCSALGAEFAQMQKAVSPRAGHHGFIELVSISIDPISDRTEALAAYSLLHRADPSIWIVTAPTQLEAGQRLLKQLQVVAIPDGAGGYVHNGAIHLLDATGRVHAIFDYSRWPEALAAARKLQGSP